MATSYWEGPNGWGFQARLSAKNPCVTFRVRAGFGRTAVRRLWKYGACAPNAGWCGHFEVWRSAGAFRKAICLSALTIGNAGIGIDAGVPWLILARGLAPGRLELRLVKIEPPGAYIEAWIEGDYMQ